MEQHALLFNPRIKTAIGVVFKDVSSRKFYSPFEFHEVCTGLYTLGLTCLLVTGCDSCQAALETHGLFFNHILLLIFSWT